MSKRHMRLFMSSRDCRHPLAAPNDVSLLRSGVSLRRVVKDKASKAPATSGGMKCPHPQGGRRVQIGGCPKHRPPWCAAHRRPSQLRGVRHHPSVPRFLQMANVIALPANFVIF